MSARRIKRRALNNLCHSKSYLARRSIGRIIALLAETNVLLSECVFVQAQT